MGLPIPSTSEAKRDLARQMRELAPELMSDIDTLRKQFPSARVTYFSAGGLEVGTPSPEGFPLDEIAKRVELKQQRIERAIAAEAERLEKKRIDAAKRARKKS